MGARLDFAVRRLAVVVVDVDDTAAVEVVAATDVDVVMAVESTTVVVEELVEESPDDEVLHPANTVTVITRRVRQRRIPRLSPNRVSHLLYQQ